MTDHIHEERLKAVSLFSGIGGFDLGLERAGIETVLQVEIDPFCRQVLARHWPDVRRIADVRDVTGEDCSGVQVLFGGPPCQPAALQGKRLGDQDDRWLWPEALRIAEEHDFDYCLFENPIGIVTIGLREVVSTLRDIGYVVPRPRVIRACGVGASHVRQRVFILAYADRLGLEGGIDFWPRIGTEAFSPPSPRWDVSPPYVCRGADGIPQRMERLKALGNAVVPQVAELVGRRLVEFDRGLRPAHIHEEYDRSAVIGCGWCICGWETDGKTWREPSTWHGQLRAAGWGKSMDIERGPL